jgi:hypothetical protein
MNGVQQNVAVDFASGLAGGDTSMGMICLFGHVHFQSTFGFRFPIDAGRALISVSTNIREPAQLNEWAARRRREQILFPGERLGFRSLRIHS